MSCPHTTTTTLLWLYGEGPEDHALHVAGCDECQAAADELTDVVCAVAPIADDLAVDVVPRAANNPSGWLFWLGGSSAVALAAAGVLAVMLPSLGVQRTAAPVETGTDVAFVADTTPEVLWAEGLADDLDLWMDDLDEDLDLFEDDLMTL